MNSRPTIPPAQRRSTRQRIRAALGFAAPTYRALRRAARFVAWVIPAVGRLARAPRSPARRLLVVHDTSSQPFSLGDILIAQEAALVLCARHGLSQVDFAIVYDPVDPAGADPAFNAINRENAFYHLASILPIAQVNPLLGSVFVLNSGRQLDALIADNRELYEVWPPAWLHGTGQYLSPVVFNGLLREHFRDQGSIPMLSCRPFLNTWAAEFFRTHASGKVAVTVNLRNNKRFHTHRNSALPVWLSFFAEMARRYPVVFIVICAISEIEDSMRDVPGVVLVKDHGTSIEQDMALIHGAAFHMGAGSGPATMAWFNEKPYLMVNTDYRNDPFFQHEGMVEFLEDGLQRFWFARPHQRIAAGTESGELLTRAFETMWAQIDQAPWLRRDESAAASNEVSSWLR